MCSSTELLLWKCQTIVKNWIRDKFSLMEGHKIWDIRLRATSRHAWSILFSYICFFLCSIYYALFLVVQTTAYRKILKVLSSLFLLRVRYQARRFNARAFMLFFIFSYSRIQYKNEPQEEKKWWWCEMAKEENKTQK